MTYDITTIGAAAIDTFLQIRDIKTTTDKKTSVREYAFPLGEKVPITHLEEHFGGNAVNAAVGFSRLGLKTAIVSSVGTSAVSETLIAYIKKKGIATKWITQSKKAAINHSFILDWEKDKSDRIILSYHQPKDFRSIRWPKTRYLYLTSLGAHFEGVAPQLPKIQRLIWNPGGYELSLGARALLPLLERTEVLIVNRTEAANLLNVDEKATSDHFLISHIARLGARTVVVTSGKHGAAAGSGDGTVLFENAIAPDDLQEVTGAGDAFASGFIAAYLYGKKLIECLRWGVLNATACIQQIGAQNGLLTFEGLRKRYREQYGKRYAKLTPIYKNTYEKDRVHTAVSTIKQLAKTGNQNIGLSQFVIQDRENH